MEPCSVTVLLTKEHVILTKGSNSLWCARGDDGKLLPGKEPDYAHLDSPTDLGKVWGCIGKIRFFTDGDWKLLLISQASSVGVLPHGGEVYCVERIAIIPLTKDVNPEIIGLEVPSDLTGEGGSTAGNPTLGVKIMKNLAGGGKDRERPREKVEKRLTEALLWMFNDSRSFYFSMETDLTRSLQRQLSREQPCHQDTPYWKIVDDRFFWNRWMISDLLDDNYVGAFADHWIIPLIQGYVEVREVPLLTGQTSDVAQGRYHHNEGRLKKKESDVDLKVKAAPGGGGGGSEAERGEGRAMIEMTEMTSKHGVEQEHENEDLKELELAVLAAKEDEGVGSGYESDSESAVSCCTDDMLNDYLDNVYGESSDLEREMDRGSDSAAADSLGSPRISGREGEGEGNVSRRLDTEEAELVGGSEKESLIEVPKLRVAEGDELRTHLGQQQQQGSGQGDVALPVGTQPVPIVSLTPAAGSNTEVARERTMLTQSNEQDQLQQIDSASGSPNNSLDLLGLDQVLPDQRSGSESSDREDSIFSRSRWRNPFLSSSLTSEFSLRQRRWLTGERKESSDGATAAVRSGEDVPTFTLAIVSRRSRHRAGTRYKRRGVDAEGNVANYVETEMLVQCGIHVVSYVLVRGSVPVYWTQPGYKYRPLPVIEKGEQETQEAFKKHFESQLQLYKELALVNLVKQTGREKTIAEAFEEHTLLLDSPHLTYIAFDFHQHYKNNQAAAIRLLLKESARLVKKFKFFWLDSQASSSALCQQEGVFRVNCMDCLDRTNVIESVYAREVLQTVLQKLGVISFEDKLSGATLLSYQELWGNNGDIISRQYAGTAAMKGDITRYGERKISGLMKDGYNSAHRYYLNVFRDTYRQVLIDLMQGESPADAFTSLPASMRGADEAVDEVLTLDPIVPVAPVKGAPKERLWSLDKEQDVTDMIHKCRGDLYPNPHLHVQCWAMMEAAGYSFLESSQREELCVLMQCREHANLCVASYNSETDKVVCFIRIPMDRIEKISIGTLGMILRSSKRLYLRIFYSLVDDMPRYFTLKTINFTSMDEDKGILLSIASALEYVQPSIIIHEQRLNKRKSAPHPGVIHLVEPDNILNKGKENEVKAVQSPNQHLDRVDEEFEEQEEEEEEPSNSVPSSPKLSVRSPLSHALSHSFDDLISNLNNEVVASPTSVASPMSPLRQITPKPVHFHPLESGESGSDSEIEMTEFSNVGKKRISASNPLSDHGLGDAIDRNQSESDTEKSSDERNNRSRRALESSSGGKFAQLKGKLLQTVNSLKPPMSALKLRYSSSRPHQNGDSDSSASHGQLQSSGKFMSVRRRHFSSSPDSSRRIRQNSPQNEPSEEELKRQKAMENSKTTFLILKAV